MDENIKSVTTIADKSEDETTEYQPFAADYDNADFNMLVREERMYYLFIDEISGDVFNDTVYERNNKVQEYYNVKLNYIPAQTADMPTLVRSSVMAGDGSYDLVMPDYYSFSITEDIFCNLLDFDVLNFDSEWWCQGWNDNITFNGKLYSCVGDFCLDLLRNTHVVYFSKQAINEYGLESPYDLTKSGVWTLDTMVEMGRNMAQDLNADGKYDLNDSYGIYSHLQSRKGVLQSIGVMITTHDNNSISYNFDNDIFYEKYEKVWNLFNNETSLLYNGDTAADFTTIPAYSVFNSGNIMFILSGLFAVDGMRTSDVDFGIVPVPKYDEAQEKYISYNHGCSPCMIPITVSDPEMSAVVLEALNYYSSTMTVPAYYEQVLKTKVTRDNDSAEMLDLIFNSLQFDFAFINNSDLKNVWTSICSVENESIASYIESNRQKWDEALESLLNPEM